MESKNAYEIGNHHYRDPRAQRKTDTRLSLNAGVAVLSFGDSEEQFFAETFSRY